MNYSNIHFYFSKNVKDTMVIEIWIKDDKQLQKTLNNTDSPIYFERNNKSKKFEILSNKTTNEKIAKQYKTHFETKEKTEKEKELIKKTKTEIREQTGITPLIDTVSIHPEQPTQAEQMAIDSQQQNNNEE